MPGKSANKSRSCVQGRNKYPSYLNAHYDGKLEKLAANALKLLGSCCICPRKCKVNRINPNFAEKFARRADQLNPDGFNCVRPEKFQRNFRDKVPAIFQIAGGRGNPDRISIAKSGINAEKGYCKTGFLPKVYSSMAHHGEEPPISGTKGSGTIFFSGCNMSCMYCQNYEFSQLDKGRDTTFEELSGYMLKLQNAGCHNINLVTPTHIMPQILKALCIAIPQGLNIPLVYNTSGYELPEMIRLLEGIVDIYLADMRYADNNMAVKYSNAPDYPGYNQESIKEMHRQAGIADIDKKGILKKGLIIRHLVLPNGISGTEKIMKFISREISDQTYISLMSQYTPFYKTEQFKEISRGITQQEYRQAQEIMEKYGLHNGWTQDSYGLSEFAGVNIKPGIYTKD